MIIIEHVDLMKRSVGPAPMDVGRVVFSLCLYVQFCRMTAACHHSQSNCCMMSIFNADFLMFFINPVRLSNAIGEMCLVCASFVRGVRQWRPRG